MSYFKLVSQEIQNLKREESFEVSGSVDVKSAGFKAKAQGGVAWGLLFVLYFLIALIMYIISRGKVNLFNKS
jgi:hypothetical protein